MLRLHSIETFGTHEGPGIRLVLFLQGCNFRCAYCHNPDTLKLEGGTEYSLEEIMELLEEQRPYFSSGGGLTVSGGEPLLQARELIKLFTLAKKAGFNTALDTNGSIRSAAARKLLTLADLVLFDLKQIDNNKHQDLTGAGNQAVLENILAREASGQPFWIRYVLVPGWTDEQKDLEGLGKFCAALKNLARLELLPYHNLGAYKYSELGLEYRLAGLKPTTSAQVDQAKSILSKYLGNIVT